jgi:hypothetical protein
MQRGAIGASFLELLRCFGACLDMDHFSFSQLKMVP